MFMGGFVFILTIFSIITDYDDVGEILNESRVNLSWPKVRVLMIMQGLVSFNIKHVICVYLIEKWISNIYDFEVKLSMMALHDDGRTKALLHDFMDWF